jgi:hypothetical protein
MVPLTTSGALAQVYPALFHHYGFIFFIIIMCDVWHFVQDEVVTSFVTMLSATYSLTPFHSLFRFCFPPFFHVLSAGFRVWEGGLQNCLIVTVLDSKYQLA